MTQGKCKHIFPAEKSITYIPKKLIVSLTQAQMNGHRKPLLLKIKCEEAFNPGNVEVLIPKFNRHLHAMHVEHTETIKRTMVNGAVKEIWP